MVVQVGIRQRQSTKDPSKLMPVSNEAISRMTQLEVVYPLLPKGAPSNAKAVVRVNSTSG